MPPSRWSHAIVALVVAASAGVSAFAPPNSSNNIKHNTELYGTTKQPPGIPMPKDISYGEESRKYRRTVYTHDDWVKHRSPDRFVRNVVSTLNSGIYKNIAGEVIAVTSVAVVACLWNGIVGDYMDFSGVQHAGPLKDTILGNAKLSLPITPFQLSSASLGLLLGTTR